MTPPIPPPLREEPPQDRFCDLVLNGGVASGVVYPWALLKLARHYRFRSIGGNSVGAMAAAIAAAAEYGRCIGVENAFEPLRRLPLELAEEQDGEAKMRRLFVPGAGLERLLRLFVIAVEEGDAPPDTGPPEEAGAPQPEASVNKATATGNAQPPARGWRGALMEAVRSYGLHRPLVAFLVSAVLALAGWCLLAVLVVCSLFWPAASAVPLMPLCLAAALLTLGVLIGFILLLAWALACVYGDMKALPANCYGFCTGLGSPGGPEGLVELMHKAIQRSAGRVQEDPPLTFADLWAAPRFGRAGPVPLAGGLQPLEPGIELQMFTSNVTQGRPVRLPVNDANTRLYFLPDEWAKFFPPTVMGALIAASTPYGPTSHSDPPMDAPEDPEQLRLKAQLLELPSGGMPIVVAARLSLSFPLLFSLVPVYAVDYESKPNDRRLRRCWLSDGGLCTNFPVHLFDAAHPRWPTFGMLLDQRLTAFRDKAVWLPQGHLAGRADNWNRSVPGAENPTGKARGFPSQLAGLLSGVILTMKDWNDRVTGRLPHIRNRIVRMALKPGEGQLNIAMPGARILHMAHTYGTAAGRELVKRFAPDDQGVVKGAWREHLYVRSVIELRAVHRHLRNYTRAVHEGGNTTPLRQVLDAARLHPFAPAPVDAGDQRVRTADVAAGQLNDAQRQALERAVQAMQTLEAELAALEAQFGPYHPILAPEMRLRPPV